MWNFSFYSETSERWTKCWTRIQNGREKRRQFQFNCNASFVAQFCKQCEYVCMCGWNIVGNLENLGNRMHIPFFHSRLLMQKRIFVFSIIVIIIAWSEMPNQMLINAMFRLGVRCSMLSISVESIFFIRWIYGERR